MSRRRAARAEAEPAATVVGGVFGWGGPARLSPPHLTNPWSVPLQSLVALYEEAAGAVLTTDYDRLHQAAQARILPFA